MDFLHQAGPQHPHPGVRSDDGVIVDGQQQVHFLPHIVFDVVDQVVGFQGVHLGGELHMEGRELAAGAVVVDHHVMDAQHPGIGQHLFFQLFHQLGRGAFAQQRAQGIPNQAPARPQDEDGHTQTHNAINDIEAGDLAQDRRHQHRAGGDDIVAAVGGGGDQGFGFNGQAHPAVEETHPQFHQDGGAQHRHRQQAEAHLFRVEDLARRLLQQAQADGHDHGAHRQARHVFIAGVPIGMLGVGGLGGQLEAHQAHHVGGGIRQVVDGIGGDGDGPEQGAHRKLARKQQQVAAHTHNTGQTAIPFPDLGVLAVLIIFDESAYQQLCQENESPFCTGSPLAAFCWQRWHISAAALL